MMLVSLNAPLSSGNCGVEFVLCRSGGGSRRLVGDAGRVRRSGSQVCGAGGSVGEGVSSTWRNDFRSAAPGGSNLEVWGQSVAG